MSRELQLPDRQVDLDTGRLSTGGELRPMELKLLRYLLQRPGKVVSHKELLARVWGYAPTAHSRTVQVTLHRLRAALEHDPAHPELLVTVPGRGVGWKGQEAPTKLAPALPPLVGREAELSWLERSTAPLVTVLGPGGAGKTRLVWEYLRRQPDSGYFLPAEDLRSPAQVARRVAAQLELHLQEPERELAEALARRGPLTLVLDSVESVGEGLGPMLLGWLSQASELRVILTSREPLSLAREQRLPLGVLPPGASRELLLARVRQGDPLYDPDSDPAFSSLGQLLDGLPLALEIVAPYVAELGAGVVVQRLGELGELAHRGQDVPERHRSLSVVVAWSLQRLSPEHLAGLHKLAVFRRWFSLELAGRLLGLPQARVVELTSSLIERGLVYRVPGTPRPRFALYAAVKGALGPAEPEHLRAHVRAWVEQVQSWYERWGGLPPHDPEIEEDTDDLIAAAWQIPEAGEGLATDELADCALREGSRTNQDMLPLAERLLGHPCGERTHARVLLWKASALSQRGQLAEMNVLRERVPELALRSGLPQVACLAELGFAKDYLTQGLRERSAASLDRAEHYLQLLPDPSSPVYAQLSGRIALRRADGRLPATERLARMRLAIEQIARGGQIWGLLLARHALSHALVSAGEHLEAEHPLQLVLQEPGWGPQALLPTWQQLASVRLVRRELDSAREAIAQAERLSDWHEIRYLGCRSLHLWASLAEAEGRYTEAVSLAARSAAESQRMGLHLLALSARTLQARAAMVGDPAACPELEPLFLAAMTHQSWHAAFCLVQMERMRGGARGQALDWACRLVELSDQQWPIAWLLRLELLREAGRALEGTQGLLQLAEGCLPARARKIRLARAAVLAEHGHGEDARLLLERDPGEAGSPWEQLWRARCRKALGHPVSLPPRQLNPADVLLQRAWEEVTGM